MRYSVGDCLGEYGFQFYEKIHEPIFLISKMGKIVKINEAGRKFLSIGHVTWAEAETKFKEYFSIQTPMKSVERIFMKINNLNIQLIASDLENSDYVLVELKH